MCPANPLRAEERRGVSRATGVLRAEERRGVSRANRPTGLKESLLTTGRTRPSGLKTPANPLRAEERRGVSRGEPPDSRPGVHARVVLGPLIGLSSFYENYFVGKVRAYIYNGINSCEASFVPNSDMIPYILS